ncbi:hypothetical protein TEA_003046 [Camellia sinensis var. sinensis]|uniref:DNL-type domain-containing protein n=1 Tax=Camellia sinensis var. sinensis TaxID=542762 RepID=A0A4V3WKY6_CAMSN|nr:hypothetical protein TEA_003046 [Camellia sinensis var. sinensis]
MNSRYSSTRLCLATRNGGIRQQPHGIGDRDGVVIVDHGSRRKESNLMLDEFVAMFRDRTGYPIVEPAHMELAEPSIRDAFGLCVQQGANRVIVSPFFLFPGRHWHQDIPSLTAEAAKGHPGVSYIITAPLGLHELLVDVMNDRIKYCLSHVAGDADECSVCAGTGKCQVEKREREWECGLFPNQEPLWQFRPSANHFFSRYEFSKRRIQTETEPSEQAVKDVESHEASLSNLTDNDDSAVKFNAASNLKISPNHDLAMIFTCKVCETRSVKTMCRQSYEKGVVVARCGGCNKLHLIADHLGWFGQPGSVEDLLAARGEEVKKGSADTLNLTLEDLAGKEKMDGL